MTMNKKTLIITFCSVFFCIVIFLLGFVIVQKRAIHYYWTNDYTETSKLKYISPTIKEIETALEKTLSMSKKKGYDYKILYQSAYGSGFMQDNPIPNDLDYHVMVDLGTFKYDGKNPGSVAKKIMKKIEYFNYALSNYIWRNIDKFYVVKKIGPLQDDFTPEYDLLVDSITASLDDAISGKEYYKYTKKITNTKKEFQFIYKVSPGKLIMEDYRPLLLYANDVYYNDDMEDYLRELSIVSCFKADILYNDEIYSVEMIPESVFTDIASLENRLYASNIFIGNGIYDYLNNLPVIKDTDTNVKYRLWAIGRHLESVIYFQRYDKRPIKYLKRMRQLKDMLGPLLDEESQTEIDRIVHENLYDRDIQLLNEYKNICYSWMIMTRFYSFYRRINNEDEVIKMNDVLTKVIDELEERGNVGEDAIIVFRNYQKEMEQFLEDLQIDDSWKLHDDVFGSKYDKHVEFVNNLIFKQLKEMDKLHELLGKCFKVLNDAGLYMVNAVCLPDGTIGIEKNDFTKRIDNINKFVKENNLPPGKYKLINSSQVPSREDTIGRRFWVRYKSTPAEDKRYEEIIDIMSKDKVNYGLKKKTIYFY